MSGFKFYDGGTLVLNQNEVDAIMHIFSHYRLIMPDITWLHPQILYEAALNVEGKRESGRSSLYFKVEEWIDMVVKTLNSLSFTQKMLVAIQIPSLVLLINSKNPVFVLFKCIYRASIFILTHNIWNSIKIYKRSYKSSLFHQQFHYSIYSINQPNLRKTDLSSSEVMFENQSLIEDDGFDLDDDLGLDD
ncbi:MAG: hypothetical protein QNL04_13905 [SAR324 cluster bacterium]|nr:hypothetical protein [SAR324 cluster bacterium]